ncbi:MAG TPA: serine/threonine-protein kinase, partial [Polyangia bacterium]|nr:serine/threonine-protein kinase [Polyangia bacterium]
EVYGAYDPELDRKVAVKVVKVRVSRSRDDRGRLMREAQAIARLSHPNVVVVYDVGTFGESVFIAMEFVEGRTLSGWMHASARSPREIMQVFFAAGRGLAAAHAAGLVHRDFKPDNVMVTDDGQVRVMDFGLARQRGEAREPGPAPASSALATAPDPNDDPDSTVNLSKPRKSAPVTSGSYLSIKLTQTGVMLGTPAYMAPEQFAVLPTDERTDQFSFGVTLYEALYGARPFGGDTFLTLMTSVTTGDVGAPPAKTRVPTWLRKVLLRTLQTDPGARFPSMEALLTALQSDPHARTRRLAVVVGVIGCVALAAFVSRRLSGAEEAMCHAGTARWVGVWEANGASSDRKEAIRRSFAATGRSFAAQAFTGSSRLLDQYVRRWLDTYTDACEAAHIRGEQSAEVLDLRMTCLSEKVTEVEALTERLSRADGTVVENAVVAASALSPLDRCSDVPLLKAVVQPPTDAATRKRVYDLRADLARLDAEKNAGHCAVAETIAGRLIPQAREVGYQPLLADVLYGAAAWDCVAPALAIQRLREAYFAGLASRKDETAASAAILLSDMLAGDMQQVEDGRVWLDTGRAMLARIGGQPLLKTWLLQAEGIFFNRDGDRAAAVRAWAAARDAKTKLLGADHPDVGMSGTGLGNMLQEAGRYEEALAIDASTAEMLAHSLGNDHPWVARVLNNEGEVLNILHRHAEARTVFERCIDIWTKTGAPASLLAYGQTGLGVALVGEGRGGEAVAPLGRALAIREEAHEPAEVLGATRFALARALWTQPRARARSLSLARQARADYAQAKVDATVATIDAWLAAPGAPVAPARTGPI